MYLLKRSAAFTRALRSHKDGRRGMRSCVFFFSSRRRHTRCLSDWSSDVCSSDLQLPEVRDIAMPAEGVFHNLILVSMRKSFPGHARKVMHAIWGTGQAMFSKCIT